MKTVCLIAILLSVSFAVQMHKMTNAQINKFESLKKGNQWAGIMMNLAELHLQAQGPLDELIEAIESVMDDLDRKTERAHSEYDRREMEHNSEVTRINGQMNSANEDIAHTTEFLNNVLYVQKVNLESDIVNLTNGIATTQQYVLDQTANRLSQHEKYQGAIIEHNEALEAVNEALEVLSQLFEGASLLQIKKAKKTMEKVTSKLGNNIEGSMAKALLALTSEQFSNQSDVQKVNDLLREISQNLVFSIAKFTEEEEKQQNDFVLDMQQSENDISRMSAELIDQTEALATTVTSIEDNEEFLEQRKRDLSGYEADLVEENENFVRITALYEELVAQLLSETQACGEALDVLQNGDIAGYIGGRMEQDVIIDQPHGSQLTVETDPFDLQ